MALMTFENITRNIRSGQYHPVYFLMGEEAFYIDVIADLLEEHVLSEVEKEFDLTIMYGRDTDTNGILSQAKRFPMMARYHMVLVREAQHVRDLENLLDYVQRPAPSCILVICYKYKTVDRRKKFIKEIEKAGVVFEGKKLYDNQVPGWIDDYVRRKGYHIGPRAAQMLADHLGADLGKIVNELGKVFINLKSGSEITPTVIEENIGISKDFNNFEFQWALGERNSMKAFQIARYFADNPRSNPLVLTLGVLYQFFSKLMIYHRLPDKSKRNIAHTLSVNEYFVGQYQQAAAFYSLEKLISIIGYLRECDIRSKGIDNSTTSEGELLKELTYKIINA